jgi:hypothetical protein
LVIFKNTMLLLWTIPIVLVKYSIDKSNTKWKIIYNKIRIKLYLSNYCLQFNRFFLVIFGLKNQKWEHCMFRSWASLKPSSLIFDICSHSLNWQMEIYFIQTMTWYNVWLCTNVRFKMRWISLYLSILWILVLYFEC